MIQQDSTIPCNGTSTSTINSNSSQGCGPFDYNPSVPVHFGHRNTELITVCVFNGMSIALILTRIWYRRWKLKIFAAEDWWIAAVGFVLIFPLTVCQIGSIVFGSGLLYQNVPYNFDKYRWMFERGFCGYFLVSAFVKKSICFCLLNIVKDVYKGLKRASFALCVLAFLLGITGAVVWVVPCRPFNSNFVYEIQPEFCLDMDMARYCFAGASILIDVGISIIPFFLLQRVGLASYKKKILMMVFGANFLGTIACGVSIYGIWVNRQRRGEFLLSEAVYVMFTDIEIFMYTLGASFPVLSKQIIEIVSRKLSTRQKSKTRPSWLVQPPKSVAERRRSGHLPVAASTWPGTRGHLRAESEGSESAMVGKENRRNYGAPDLV